MDFGRAHLELHLCRRYAATILCTNSFLQERPRERSHGSITWLLGWMPDGLADILAVWDSGLARESAAALAFEDVNRRGTEFIGLALGQPFHAERAFRRLFHPSKMLPSVTQALEAAESSVARRHVKVASAAILSLFRAPSLQEARAELIKFDRTPVGAAHPEVVAQWLHLLAESEWTYAIPPELRQMVTSADLAAAEVRARIARAIQRHGPFASAAAARDFVALALRRAERRLNREHAAAIAEQSAARGASTLTFRATNFVTGSAALA